jgi:arginase
VHLHADSREFVLHLDIDVIAQEEFPAVNLPRSGGLRFNDARTSFDAFVRSKSLIGLDIAQYNPDKDPDGSGAKKLVDLLVEVLAHRLESPAESADSAPEAASASN